MRIAILTQYFPPEMGAPQARLFELAKRLRARGHELTVVTAMPNYPTGRVFDEYRWRLFCQESLDGIRVLRTPILPSKSDNLIIRLLSYMSFVVTSLLLGTWKLGKQDVLIVESPPLFLGLSGFPMSLWARARLLLMVSDIWPDVAVRMGGVISERQQRILEWLEAWTYRRADCVAFTNPGAVKQVQERFDDLKCAVISNGVDTTFFRPDLRSEEVRKRLDIEKGQFAIGYCGLHGIFQGLDAVVRAAQLLQDEPEFRFIMVGDGPTKDALMAQAREAGLRNIIFHPRQPKHLMPEIIASLDVSLVPLAAPLPGTMPSKVFEAMASGVPTVVTADCEAEQLVERYEIGAVFPAGDGERLAQILKELLSDREALMAMRSRSIEAAKRFDREVIAGRTESILESVVSGSQLPEIVW